MKIELEEFLSREIPQTSVALRGTMEWTDDEKRRMIEMKVSGMRLQEIAARLGRTTMAVNKASSEFTHKQKELHLVRFKEDAQ